MPLRIRFRQKGRIRGVQSTVRQIEQAVAEEVANATIRRVEPRLNDHPSGQAAAAAMSVEAGAGQATILSPMGNPGTIPASRDAQGFSRWGKRALWWPGARHPVKWVRNYRGLRPLIEAEMSRVDDRDMREINMTTR